MDADRPNSDEKIAGPSPQLDGPVGANPPWAQELADLYFSGSVCLFLLHGNVHDLVPSPASSGGTAFCTLPEFLSRRLFGSWDVVFSFDLGRGLRAAA